MLSWLIFGVSFQQILNISLVIGLIIGIFLMPTVLTLREIIFVEGDGLEGIKRSPLLFFENILRRILH